MLKTKTEQNRNDEIYNQTDVTVKIHTNYYGVRATAIMLRSIAASSPWWSPVIVVKQASDTASAVLRVKKRASFDILLDVFGGRPHQSLQPSFKALSTRAIFMFRWIRRSFIHKTLALKSLFSTCYVTKDLRVFISHNLAEYYWTFYCQILKFGLLCTWLYSQTRTLHGLPTNTFIQT